MSHKIMIVEDEPKIATEIADYLGRYGYQPVLVTRFDQVEEQFRVEQPHMVLMDVNLPWQDGFQLTRLIRRQATVPILFLSARSGEMEQVLGMESGGDDYLTKPFQLELLLAKVRAMLRRAYGEYAVPDAGGRSLLRVGALELDLAAAELRDPQASLPLGRNELKLLHLFFEQPDRVISRDRCLEALWDDSAFVDDNTLAVNISRVRGRLDHFGSKEALQTRRGLGYVLISSALKAGS